MDFCNADAKYAIDWSTLHSDRFVHYAINSKCQSKRNSTYFRARSLALFLQSTWFFFVHSYTSTIFQAPLQQCFLFCPSSPFQCAFHLNPPSRHLQLFSSTISILSFLFLSLSPGDWCFIIISLKNFSTIICKSDILLIYRTNDMNYLWCTVQNSHKTSCIDFYRTGGGQYGIFYQIHCIVIDLIDRMSNWSFHQPLIENAIWSCVTFFRTLFCHFLSAIQVYGAPRKSNFTSFKWFLYNLLGSFHWESHLNSHID